MSVKMDALVDELALGKAGRFEFLLHIEVQKMGRRKDCYSSGSLIVIERNFSGHRASQIISAGFGLSHDSETPGILDSVLRSFDFDACARPTVAAKKVVVAGGTRRQLRLNPVTVPMT